MIGIDMKMPENCSECEIENFNMKGYVCGITGERTTGVREAIREKHCPLREIKDEEIEADADQLKAGDEVKCRGDLGVVIWAGVYKIEVMWDDGSAGIASLKYLKRPVGTMMRSQQS